MSTPLARNWSDDDREEKLPRARSYKAGFAPVIRANRSNSGRAQRSPEPGPRSGGHEKSADTTGNTDVDVDDNDDDGASVLMQ